MKRYIIIQIYFILQKIMGVNSRQPWKRLVVSFLRMPDVFHHSQITNFWSYGGNNLVGGPATAGWRVADEAAGWPGSSLNHPSRPASGRCRGVRRPGGRRCGGPGS